MRTKFTHKLFAVLLTLVMALGSLSMTVSAEDGFDVPAKEALISLYDRDGGLQMLYHFELNDPANPVSYNVIGGVGTDEVVNTAEYYNGMYYFATRLGLFGTIDPETGTITQISDTAPYGAISYNPADGRMYGLTLGNSPDLYTVDIADGAAAHAVDVDDAVNPFTLAMAITNDGRFLVVDGGNNCVSELDPVTGALTTLIQVDFDVNFAQDMSVDRETNTVYWAARNNSAKISTLYVVDTENRQLTYVGDFPSSASCFAIRSEEPTPEPTPGAIRGFYFETDPALDGWTWEDRDGDGYNWQWINGIDDWGYPEGQGCMNSQSYVNYVGSLTPDNWLISPVVPGGGTLSFMLRAQDDGYPNESIGVYASTDGGVTWSEELGYFTPKRDPGPVFTFTASLADYADQQIELAFRHYDSTDEFSVNLDAVEVSGGGELPNYTVTFIDGVTGEEIEGSYPVEAGTVLDPDDFPIPPEHEGYRFNCWDYDGAEILGDTYIYALYDVEITFCDWNGVPFDTELIPYDCYRYYIDEPDAPEHNGYTFTSWSPEFENPHYYDEGPKTYIAQYEFNHPDDPDIIFRTNTVYTKPGETVPIDFSVEALRPYECHAFTGFIYYEPSELTLVDDKLIKGEVWQQIEELGGMVAVDIETPGKIGFAVIMPNAGFNISGIIFSMDFHVDKYHDWQGYKSPLFIEITKCSNYPAGGEETPIIYDIENGSVNIYDMLFGDVNWDGKVDTTDVILIMRHTLDVQTLTGKYFAAADVNHDGIANATDALLIMRYIMNQE